MNETNSVAAVAVVAICAARDLECGDKPLLWCATCAKRTAARNAENTERMDWIASVGYVTINSSDAAISGGAPFVEITDASAKVLGIGRTLAEALDDARGH